MVSKGILYRLRKCRPLALRAVVLATLPALLWLQPLWTRNLTADLLLECLGQVLIVAGVLGRLWCTLHIGGRKNRDLVTTGPYALCRNPLYLFSFLLGLGVTMVFQNSLMLLLFLPLFALFHGVAVILEERKLAALFGESYENYRREVPRFLPALKISRRTETIGLPEPVLAFSTRHALRAVLDSGIYLTIIPLAEVFEQLYQQGLLPLHW